MRILLTVAFMDGYHGAVMHIRDFAAYLKRRGDQVTVATIFVAPAIEEIFTALEIPVTKLEQTPLDENYDIVFAYHYPTIGYLLQQGLKCSKLVLGSLSGIGRLETFPLYWPSASLLTVMSYDTARRHNLKYGLPLEKMYVFENPIPNEFAEYKITRKIPKDYPQKIAVVSNHLTEEVKDLPQYLPKTVTVTYFGKESGNYLEMKPELLSDYDVVITIGKTIQYTLGLGICAYEYDWFGGCGYITPQNMAAEADEIFCGRLTGRKLTAEDMAQELMANYSSCCAQLAALKEMACQRFLVSNSGERLLKAVEQAPVFVRENLAKAEYNEALDLVHADCFAFWTKNLYKYKNESEFFKEKSRSNYEQLQECWKGRGKLWAMFQNQQKKLAASQDCVKQLEQQLQQQKLENAKLKKDLKNVKEGLSFRIGRIITALPRMLLGKK